jgi:hypothetical protein
MAGFKTKLFGNSNFAHEKSLSYKGILFAKPTLN